MGVIMGKIIMDEDSVDKAIDYVLDLMSKS